MTRARSPRLGVSCMSVWPALNAGALEIAKRERRGRSGPLPAAVRRCFRAEGFVS